MTQSKRQFFVSRINQTLASLRKSAKYMEFLIDYCDGGKHAKFLKKIDLLIENSIDKLNIFLSSINELKRGHLDYIRSNKFKS